MISHAHRIAGVSINAAGKTTGAETRALLLGLDDAGKTGLLYKLKLGEVVTAIRTIGFNVETVDAGARNVTIWDVGGTDRIRLLWRHYVASTQMLIWAVDAANPDRFDESATVLLDLLTREDQDLKAAALVVVATKQDLPHALAPDAVWNALLVAAPGLVGAASARTVTVVGFSLHADPPVRPCPLLLALSGRSADTLPLDRRGRGDAAAAPLERLSSIVARFVQGQLEHVHTCLAPAVGADLVLPRLGAEDTAPPRLLPDDQPEPAADRGMPAPMLSGKAFPYDLLCHVLSFLSVTDLLPTVPSFLLTFHAAQHGEDDDDDDGGSDSATNGAVLLVSKPVAWCALHSAAGATLRAVYQRLDKSTAVATEQRHAACIERVCRTALYLAVPMALVPVHARLCAVLLYHAVSQRGDVLVHLLRPSGSIGSLFPTRPPPPGKGGCRADAYSEVLPLAAFLYFLDAERLSIWPQSGFVGDMMAMLVEKNGQMFDVQMRVAARLQAAARRGIALVLASDTDPRTQVLDQQALQGLALTLEAIDRTLVVKPSLVADDAMVSLIATGRYATLELADNETPAPGFMCLSMAALYASVQVLTGHTPSYCKEVVFLLGDAAGCTPVLRELLLWALPRANPCIQRITFNSTSTLLPLQFLVKPASKRFRCVRTKEFTTLVMESKDLPEDAADEARLAFIPA